MKPILESLLHGGKFSYLPPDPGNDTNLEKVKNTKGKQNWRSTVSKAFYEKAKRGYRLVSSIKNNVGRVDHKKHSMDSKTSKSIIRTILRNAYEQRKEDKNDVLLENAFEHAALFEMGNMYSRTFLIVDSNIPDWIVEYTDGKLGKSIDCGNNRTFRLSSVERDFSEKRNNTGLFIYDTGRDEEDKEELERIVKEIAENAVDTLQELAMVEMETLRKRLSGAANNEDMGENPQQQAIEHITRQFEHYEEILDKVETPVSISFSQRGTSTSIFFSERIHRDATYAVMDNDFFRENRKSIRIGHEILNVALWKTRKKKTSRRPRTQKPTQQRPKGTAPTRTTQNGNAWNVSPNDAAKNNTYPTKEGISITTITTIMEKMKDEILTQLLNNMELPTSASNNMGNDAMEAMRKNIKELTRDLATAKSEVAELKESRSRNAQEDKEVETLRDNNQVLSQKLTAVKQEMALLKENVQDTTRQLRKIIAKKEQEEIKLRASLVRAREETMIYKDKHKDQPQWKMKKAARAEKKQADELTEVKNKLAKEKNKNAKLTMELNYFKDCGDIVDMSEANVLDVTGAASKPGPVPMGLQRTPPNKRERPEPDFLGKADIRHKANATFFKGKETTSERAVSTWIDEAGYVEIRCWTSPEISLIHTRRKPVWDDDKIGKYVYIDENSKIHLEPIHNDQ